MLNIKKIDFKKYHDRLVPCIVQDYQTMQVLMLGFMNNAALSQTIKTKKVTFYSRTKKRLWVKGETSKNFLHVIDINTDCDNDTILVFAKADGPTCHTGKVSCFQNEYVPPISIIAELNNVIAQRYVKSPKGSYTASLFASGVKRISQKVGEEGVETALAAAAGDNMELTNEASDLIYHLLVLLKAKKLDFDAVSKVLKGRMK